MRKLDHLIGSCMLGAIAIACVACSGDSEPNDKTKQTTGNGDEDGSSGVNVQSDASSGASSGVGADGDSQAEQGSAADDSKDSSAISDSGSSAAGASDTPSGGGASASSGADSEVTNQPSSDGSSAIDGSSGMLLVDDGEDGDASTLVGPFQGFWYTYDDQLECENADPSGELSPLPEPLGGPAFTMTSYESADVSPPPIDADENLFGIRFSGGGQTLWGAGLGVGLNNGTGQLEPIDLSELGAVTLSFWARAGSETDLAVGLSDAYSEPSQGLCVARDVSTCSPEGCHDTATYRVELSDEWALFQIPLNEFVRDGWGLHIEGVSVPVGVDLTRVFQLQFRVPPQPAFDVWIDNVAFLVGDAAEIPSTDGDDGSTEAPAGEMPGDDPSGAETTDELPGSADAGVGEDDPSEDTPAEDECALPQISSMTCADLDDNRFQERPCYEPQDWEGLWEASADADLSDPLQACPPPDVLLPARPTQINSDCQDYPLELCEAELVAEDNGMCCYKAAVQSVFVCCG